MQGIIISIPSFLESMIKLVRKTYTFSKTCACLRTVYHNVFFMLTIFAKTTNTHTYTATVKFVAQ